MKNPSIITLSHPKMSRFYLVKGCPRTAQICHTFHFSLRWSTGWWRFGHLVYLTNLQGDPKERFNGHYWCIIYEICWVFGKWRKMSSQSLPFIVLNEKLYCESMNGRSHGVLISQPWARPSLGWVRALSFCAWAGLKSKIWTIRFEIDFK